MSIFNVHLSFLKIIPTKNPHLNDTSLGEGVAKNLSIHKLDNKLYLI